MAKILIAEDDDTLRDLVVRALNDDGHELTVATDGVAALEALNRQSSKFDLLLTDVIMPEMLGNEVAAEVRAEESSTRRPSYCSLSALIW